MKILITGAEGFVGRNLAAALAQKDGAQLLRCDIGTGDSELEAYAKDCDFVFHLAGANRPAHEAEFMAVNFGLTDRLMGMLEDHGKSAGVLMSSSVQAAQGGPYGQSKKAGEDRVFEYGEKTGADVFVYRLPGLFGKWSRPDYNSVVATFCHNTARGLPLSVHDAQAQLRLCYIDDVVDEFLAAMGGAANRQGRFCAAAPEHRISVGELARQIGAFAHSEGTTVLPDLKDPLTRKLFSTYLSYLPPDRFSQPVKAHTDGQSAFAELLRMPDGGQVSVNVIGPGVTRGQHWHRSKAEKFFVVCGRGVIRFRQVDGTHVISHDVSADRLCAVDIPPGYAHSITNTGEQAMVTLMWASEWFDPDEPDTFPMPVQRKK